MVKYEDQEGVNQNTDESEIGFEVEIDHDQLFAENCEVNDYLTTSPNNPHHKSSLVARVI
jgi:hypothetical protein